MPKAHLTAAFVANAGCEVGRKKTDWYDKTVTGFTLECRCTGGKTYYLRYPDPAGRQKQFKIGRYEDVTFAAANKRAVQLRSEAVMGGDPGAKKAEAKAIPLYRELSAMHLADAKLTQRSYSTTEMYVRRHIIPKWGKVRLTDIEPRGVSQWLGEKRAEGLAPATVEKIRVIFGRSFELGARWGIPGTDKNPIRAVSRKPFQNARERYLSAESRSAPGCGGGVPEYPASAHRRPPAADGRSGARAPRRTLGARRCRTADVADTDFEDRQA